MKKCIKCGSHAFNLYAEGINQGGFCDVHYWQGRAHRAEALAQPEQEPIGLKKLLGDIQVSLLHGDVDCRVATANVLGVLITNFQEQPEQEPVGPEYIGIPVAYQYLYSDGSWRCSFGDQINGSKPIASRALYARKDGK